MIVSGIWIPRAQRQGRVYQPRHRRSGFGELIQIDGSLHDWFEGRGPKCVLLVYIDDATSRLLELCFVSTESTFDYFHSTQRYLTRYGKPIVFYSFKHGVFRVNAPGATSGTGMTQFGRAFNELNIDIICADTRHIKGRVERADKTLQDRLVKELRLHGINDMEAANDYVYEFREDFNVRFGKEPKCDIDVHRPLNGSEDLDRIFSWQEQRKVTGSQFMIILIGC